MCCHVWGVLAVYGVHCVWPAQGSVCFPCLHCSGSRVLFRGTFQSGSCFCALPRSKPLRFSGTPQGHRRGWTCIFSLRRSKQLRQPGAWQAQSAQVGSVSYHLPYPSLSVSWVAAGTPISGVPCIFSGELISGCDPPIGRQPSRIPKSLG